MGDDPPTVGCDASYIESRGAESGCPERELWRAVLRQAGEDVFSTDETVRQDAISFFESDDLLRVMDLAGISRAEAPWLRRRALELASTAQHTPTGPGKRITFRGQTRNISEWAAAAGLSIHILGRRLRNGWSIEKALTVPGRSLRQRRLDRLQGPAPSAPAESPHP